MKIAVVGTGISGLSAAWLLRQHHEVRVFEIKSRLGGHTNTRTVDDPQGPLAIDTGFIVHNDRNYPRLVALFDLLGIQTQDSEMSFSASLDAGAVEYAGDALFAQRSNVFKLSHWTMLADIVRFNRLGKRALVGTELDSLSLGQWLDRHRLSAVFESRYLLPMAASIWSSPSQSIREFSARAFLEFFHNHGLLDLKDRPQWRTVVGGSAQYLDRMSNDLQGAIQLNCGVVSVRREGLGIRLTDTDGQQTDFDAVVFGCHADEALAMLEDADDAEQGLLGCFAFRENRALLHSDTRLMPVRRSAWSAWNYLTRSDYHAQAVSVSYWMNRLQRFQSVNDYFVTLNPLIEPDENLVHYETTYTHPVFDQETRLAQASMGLLQGHRSCWYCGAWMGYGFHEDGLGASIEAVSSIGVQLPPTLESARQAGPPYMGNTKPWSGLGRELING